MICSSPQSCEVDRDQRVHLPFRPPIFPAKLSARCSGSRWPTRHPHMTSCTATITNILALPVCPDGDNRTSMAVFHTIVDPLIVSERVRRAAAGPLLRMAVGGLSRRPTMTPSSPRRSSTPMRTSRMSPSAWPPSCQSPRASREASWNRETRRSCGRSFIDPSTAGIDDALDDPCPRADRHLRARLRSTALARWLHTVVARKIVREATTDNRERRDPARLPKHAGIVSGWLTEQQVS